MKILQINCVYSFGSTGKLVKYLHDGLRAAGHSSVVCYGRGQKTTDDGVFKVSSELEAKLHSVFSRLFGEQFGFSPVATAKTIKIINREKPDVVHLHCLNGNFLNVYRVVNYLKRKKIKTVLTLHAEIMHTAGCEHAVDCEKWKTECQNCPKIRGKLSRFFRDDARRCYRKIKAAFDGFQDLTVVGVSKWLTDRATLSPVFKGAKFYTVHNGIDTDTFKPTPSNIKETLGIPNGKKVILHVTPNFRHPIKGGEYVTKLAQLMPEQQFIIVGAGTDNTEFPKNVLTLSHTSDAYELAKLYTLADVTLLTSLRETFSMVCAESLCCGTPVAGFYAGGPESIALVGFSKFCGQGDVETLKQNLITLCETQKTDFFPEATSAYSCGAMVEKYISLYQN